jgi:PAS domain S-box-containing protein
MHLEWSDEIYRIFGTEPQSFGADLDAFIRFLHPDDREFVERSYRESVENKTIYNINHRIVKPDGEVRSVHEQCITHYDEGGNPLYSLGVVQDITEQVKAQNEIEIHRNHLEDVVKQRTGELAVSNRKLLDEVEKERQVELLLKESLEKEKELNELKSRFISTTSHEFRTPLTSILSSMQLIQRYRKRWTDDKVEDQFARVKNSIKYLTDLLDDILTISHADSGRIIFNPQVVDLHKYSLELIEEVRHKANEGHSFIFDFRSVKKEFLLDQKLIRFIIINLLSNAFKYSPDGGEVRLKINSTPQFIEITVSDEGIGILPEDKEHLFKPFYRSGNTGDIEGNGLGLSIVKRAVELHKGEITYYSKPDKGTRFVIKIPEKN